MRHSPGLQALATQNVRTAKRLWPNAVRKLDLVSLASLTNEIGLSVVMGDLLFLGGRWYVTHAGLMRLAHRKRCAGIQVDALWHVCDVSAGRFCFKATAYTSRSCKGFVGYGDADPSNVSPLVHGAEMRVAETRAVNRALRKAYGIGICSVEEIGSFDRSVTPERLIRKLPPKSANGNCSNGHGSNGNANGNGTRVRDRLCQLIRQHKLDAELVKSYAVDFCETTTLREASRERVEKFVAHLAECAAKDRNSLICQLNTYAQQKEGAA